jgi:hypothetical protein
MASSSVLKMAAVLVLALFTVQLLMATPAAAYGSVPMDASICNTIPGFRCKDGCFGVQYAFCYEFPTLFVQCNVYAFGVCQIKLT